MRNHDMPDHKPTTIDEPPTTIDEPSGTQEYIPYDIEGDPEAAQKIEALRNFDKYVQEIYGDKPYDGLGHLGLAGLNYRLERHSEHGFPHLEVTSVSEMKALIAAVDKLRNEE